MLKFTQITNVNSTATKNKQKGSGGSAETFRELVPRHQSRAQIKPFLSSSTMNVLVQHAAYKSQWRQEQET